MFVSQDGKRTSRRVRDKKAAESVAREISAQLQFGRFDSEPNQTAPLFQTYAQSWLETSVTEANEYKQSTMPNPALGLRGILKKRSKPEEEIDPLSVDELNLLLGTIHDSKKTQGAFLPVPAAGQDRHADR